jgi:type VI secretion system secreted protein VgrG
MGQYVQAEFPLQAHTVLGDDVLLLRGLTASEGVSAPYELTLDLLSEDAAISADELLRTGVGVSILLDDGKERLFHGRVRRFVQLDRSAGLTAYRAEVVPWLWFLSLSTDCRIFQHMTVPDIVKSVFDELGHDDYRFELGGGYPQREYCVMYRETHLNFVSRLLEEEGIFYFFEHEQGRHVLVLADANAAIPYCPARPKVRMTQESGLLHERDVVTSLQHEQAVYTGKVTLRDYNCLEPLTCLETSVAGEEEGELYDYPGRYASFDEGDRYATLRLQERAVLRDVVRGASTCAGLQGGCRIDLVEHYRGDLNRTYHLLQVVHRASTGGYRSDDGGGAFAYENSFVATPITTPYRPPLSARRPVVRGSQTAVVVGKGGEEIWVDKHGRVKVQFHWDRLGKKDDASSCWVRVSSVWAGKSWGFVQIPRIGQEVVVDFLEGDPDQPIITGRVYNADQTPPYALPGSQTQSGLKSRSSKGGSGENFNELRFEDKKGEEEVYLHAERNQTIVVEHDESVSIGHDRTEKVGNDERITIGANRTESVGKDESISIGANRTESVGKDESISIDGSRTESVGKDESIEIGANRTESVGKNESITIGENCTIRIGKDEEINVGKRFALVAGDQITLQTGQATIVMKKDGTITIKGKDVRIEGSGKIDVKASANVTIKGSQVKAN